MVAPDRSNLWAMLLRLLAWTAVAVALLAGSALVIAWILGLVRPEPWQHPMNLLLGMVCGLIAWLFLALFHLRRETWAFPNHQPFAFLMKLGENLRDLGYEIVTQDGAVVIARPGFHALLPGNGVRLVAFPKEIRVTGPRWTLERLRHRLYIEKHLQRTHQIFLDETPRNEPLLKRVELSLRLGPDQLDLVRRYVLEPLQQEAEVLCDLHLLAHSGTGIRESTVESLIRPWLDQHGIAAEITINHVQLAKA